MKTVKKEDENKKEIIKFLECILLEIKKDKVVLTDWRVENGMFDTAMSIKFIKKN